jgi:uncharacterized protein (UPF0332 family)
MECRVLVKNLPESHHRQPAEVFQNCRKKSGRINKDLEKKSRLEFFSFPTLSMSPIQAD